MKKAKAEKMLWSGTSSTVGISGEATILAPISPFLKYTAEWSKISTSHWYPGMNYLSTVTQCSQCLFLFIIIGGSQPLVHTWNLERATKTEDTTNANACSHKRFRGCSVIAECRSEVSRLRTHSVDWTKEGKHSNLEQVDKEDRFSFYFSNPLK